MPQEKLFGFLSMCVNKFTNNQTQTHKYRQKETERIMHGSLHKHLQTHTLFKTCFILNHLFSFYLEIPLPNPSPSSGISASHPPQVHSNLSDCMPFHGELTKCGTLF